MFQSLVKIWTPALRDPSFVRRMTATLLALGTMMFATSRFLVWVEQRPGVVLSDPILEHLPPHDFTWLIFLFIYVGVAGAFAILARHPRLLLTGLQAYVLMLVLRMLAMSLVPLAACPGMIPLRDPLVEKLGSGLVLTQDLFFSGHTSTLSLIFLAVPGGRVTKALFFSAILGVAICLLWQHVHYSFDVLAAPMFAYASYRFAELWLNGTAREENQAAGATR